jgi:hypothetical protein
VDLCKICSTDANYRPASANPGDFLPTANRTDRPGNVQAHTRAGGATQATVATRGLSKCPGFDLIYAGEVAGGSRTLRLKNKKLREASTPNWLMAKLLKAMADRIPSIVENRLEPYAIQGANKEPAELRSLGKSTNDTIRAEVHSFLEVWSAKWDELATESRETA